MTPIRLPIDGHLENLAKQIAQQRFFILKSPPGTGKTLRLPPRLAQDGPTIVLVPKRLAAVSAASRVAEEKNWSLGDQVGYQVRFDSKYSNHTSLVYMTEGVFVKKLADKNFINSLKYIVLDEFHERTTHIDLILAVLYEKSILDPDFKAKVILMSATLDLNHLKNFLQDVKEFEIQVPTYPLNVIKSSKPQRLQVDDLFSSEFIQTLQKALQSARQDVLVFLPGLPEIRRVHNEISKRKGLFQNYDIEILHSSISLDDQKKILSPHDRKRIILSTNIAESSLTLPSIDTVIDSGLEKKSVLESKLGFERLVIKRISKFSSTQRSGRAARTGPGVVFQLWHETDERSMPESIEPEILKSDLFEETLVLASLGYKNPSELSWLTKPKALFQPVQDELRRMKLISSSGELTEVGRWVCDSPMNTKSSAVFVDLCLKGHIEEASRFFAFIESSDPQKLGSGIDLDAPTEWPLDTFLGKKIQQQLYQLGLKIKSKYNSKENKNSILMANSSKAKIFRDDLVKSFAVYYPERVAQKKDLTTALSSKGRGLELSELVAKSTQDYLIVLMGRDLNEAKTLCQWAIPLSKSEIQKIIETEVSTETFYKLDLEQEKIFQMTAKSLGHFKMSPEVKTPIKKDQEVEAFKFVFQSQPNDLFKLKKDLSRWLEKIIFIEKQAWSPQDFSTQDDPILRVIEIFNQNFADQIKTLNDFLNFPLENSITELLPVDLKSFLNQMPDAFRLPNGKSIFINYADEKAPLISVKLQDLLGLVEHPFLLGRKPYTIEILAPNMRPTQTTQDLTGFWKNSYFEVRKDLRARYPKHDWPENPLDWSPEMSKKFKKHQP